MKNARKHPEDMTAAELAHATRQFDLPQAFAQARPMTPPELAQERSLRRGRPRIGQGATKISISLERGVLQEADALARKRGVKRSELIARFVVAGLKRRGVIALSHGIGGKLPRLRPLQSKIKNRKSPGAPMILPHAHSSPTPALPGISRRTLVHGTSMMLVEFSLQAGASLPIHAHPHEQAGYLVAGKIRLTVGAETRDLTPGDSYYAPANTPHGATALEPAIVIDTFHPPRADYL